MQIVQNDSEVYLEEKIDTNSQEETSLGVQWLRLCAPHAPGSDLIPGQGTRSHMLQLRVHMPQLKILRAATKTRHSQINYFLKKE